MEKEWFVWEKIRRIYPIQTLDFLTYISVLPAPATHIPAGVKFDSKDVELLCREKDFNASGKKIANATVENPAWFGKSLDAIEEKASAYFNAAQEVIDSDLRGKTKAELKEIFNKVYDAYLESHFAGMHSLMAECADEKISKKIRGLLKKNIAKKKIRIVPEKAFAILCQTKKESSLSAERKEIIRLIETVVSEKPLSDLFDSASVEQIQQVLSEKFPEFDALLTAHWKKFEWIFFMYEGPVLGKDYFIKEIMENKGALEAMKKEFSLNERLLVLQQKLLKRLGSTENEKIIFSFPRRLVETKAIRKDAMYFGCFAMEKLFAEIAKLLGISLDEVRYMQRQELLDALDGKFSDFFILKKRIEYSVFFAIEGKRTFLVGSEAKKWVSENLKTVESKAVSKLNGTPAFHGFARGRVKIINHPNEVFKMNKGDILVSHTTNPNLLPAMTMAAAIVTDIGGLTCHAAIVSREFRIPCVVGTKFATQVLQDGDLVEVDAEKGTIKIIKK